MHVLVTGGTRGIGRAIVKASSAAGYIVLVGCHSAEAGEEVVASLNQSHCRHKAIIIDVASADSVAAASEEVRELLSARGVKLGALVNNAGVLLERASLESLNEIIEPTLAINFDGVVRVTEAFEPLLEDGGQIINVSSGAGTRAAGKLSDARIEALNLAQDAEKIRKLIKELSLEEAKQNRVDGETPIYGLSKAGVNFYTQLSSRSLAPRVRVNACSPGFCDTEIAGGGPTPGGRRPKDPELGASVVSKLLSGRIGSCESGKFFKECSMPGTSISASESKEVPWIS